MPAPGTRFSHRDAGTEESAWLASLEVATLPRWRLPSAGTLVVVAPHPDDETLGAGGLLAMGSRAGLDAKVLLLSDGELGGSQPSRALASMRRREFVQALKALGPRIEVLPCGLPDGALASHAVEIERGLYELLKGASLCAGPFEDDGHPDHEVAAVVARCAACLRGIPYLAYPIWFWHWANAAGPLPVSAVQLELDSAVRRRKAAALACYRSQRDSADPILSPTMLAHFERPFEVFF